MMDNRVMIKRNPASQPFPHDLRDVVGFLPTGLDKTKVFELGEGALKKSPTIISMFARYSDKKALTLSSTHPLLLQCQQLH
jgi:hypothetical protein